MLLGGALVALLLAVASEPSRRYALHLAKETPRSEAVSTDTTFGLVFWILTLALVITVIVGYASR
jgi:hypothetical protein